MPPTETEFEALRHELRLTQERLAALERARQRRGRWGFLALIAVVSATAFGQHLVAFSPNTPALATDVNNNFQALKTWLEAKVGPVGDPLSLPNPLPATTVGGASIFSAGSVKGPAIATGTVTSAHLECFDPNARATYGMCIFKDTNYIYTSFTAATYCKNAGARLCTASELGAAFRAGLDYCAYTWIADTNTTQGYAGYSTQSSAPGCGGSPGVYVQTLAHSSLRGVACCK